MNRFLSLFVLNLALTGLAALPVVAHAAPVGTPQGARPANNPGSWATTADYPPEALSARVEGVVNFVVTIDTNGMVSSCRVTRTSGSELLDTKTCALISERAQFTPARDAYGAAVQGAYSNRVRWVLPVGNLPAPQAKDVAYSCILEIDGQLAGCTILRAAGLDDAMRRSLEAFIAHAPKTAPLLDDAGKPVRRRVTFEQAVRIEPAP